MNASSDFTACRWRTGRKVGRTIYAQVGPEPSDYDPLIGLMDTVQLAQEVVDAHNHWVIEQDDSLRRAQLDAIHSAEVRTTVHEGYKDWRELVFAAVCALDRKYILRKKV